MAAKKPAKERVASWVVTDNFWAKGNPWYQFESAWIAWNTRVKRVADASRSQRPWCG